MTDTAKVCERCGAFGDLPHGWRKIPGCDWRYEVNALGDVRSLRMWRGKDVPRLLTKVPDSHGYPSVTLSGRKMNVHRAVMLAFVGERPDGAVVRHLDDDKNHNCLTNLTYGTYSENQLDRVRLGNHAGANRTHCVNGHEFTSENTLLERSGAKRSCRECKRQHFRNWATRNPR